MQNNIEVRLFAYLRQGRGKQLFLNAQTVQDVLDQLQIDIIDAYVILINGKDGTLDTSLQDGDIVSLFPQVGGG